MDLIKPFSLIEDKIQIFPIDENKRSIYSYRLNDCQFSNHSLFYPNPIAYSHKEKQAYYPINEKIMSLEKAKGNNLGINLDKINKTISENLFFFVYNTDNYFHFVYDSLPYLITFLELKKNMDIKLLMSMPNQQKNDFYPFVKEFLDLLQISSEDIVLINKSTLYKNIFFSTSYTHDFNSNAPPRKEIYSFFKSLSKFSEKSTFPKKIYISRRSWIHNDTSIIGTNYTLRRKLINENEIVSHLLSLGYTEIFTEKLSTKEKLGMFSNASNVVAPMGGGIANMLFAPEDCFFTGICSPGIMDVNARFIYSLAGKSFNLLERTRHYENSDFLTSMRVQYNDIIGEIVSINKDSLTISFINENIAGWNNEMNYKQIQVPKEKCQKLDNGLNSPWIMDLNELKETKL